MLETGEHGPFDPLKDPAKEGEPPMPTSGRGSRISDRRPPFIQPMMGPHDWDQSYLHDRPIGRGEDVSTWDVHPGAIDMEKLYVMMTDYWKFDEKLHQITLDMNTTSMAKFMR